MWPLCLASALFIQWCCKDGLGYAAIKNHPQSQRLTIDVLLLILIPCRSQVSKGSAVLSSLQDPGWGSCHLLEYHCPQGREESTGRVSYDQLNHALRSNNATFAHSRGPKQVTCPCLTSRGWEVLSYCGSRRRESTASSLAPDYVSIHGLHPWCVLGSVCVRSLKTESCVQMLSTTERGSSRVSSNLKQVRVCINSQGQQFFW